MENVTEEEYKACLNNIQICNQEIKNEHEMIEKLVDDLNRLTQEMLLHKEYITMYRESVVDNQNIVDLYMANKKDNKQEKIRE